MSHGTAVAETSERGQQHETGLREEPPQDGHGGHAHERGDGEGLDHPQHHVLQRVHVVDHPSHEVAAPEQREPGRRHRFEAFVDADAQVGQHAQRRIVADQPLAVAKEAARQTEELDADDGQGERGLGRVLGRPRDQPGRRPHQGD